MSSEQPQGPFCQSCCMPMGKPEQFGTEADGARSQEYCCYCWKDGKFTDPDVTMEQMIEKVGGMIKGMPEAQAREIAETYIPKLKRWQGGRKD